MRKETRCFHIGYSFRLTARVLLYAPSHRQDSTYHGLCYTSHGALAGTRNSSMGSPHEGLIRWRIAPWANTLTTELHLAPDLLLHDAGKGRWSVVLCVVPLISRHCHMAGATSNPVHHRPGGLNPLVRVTRGKCLVQHCPWGMSAISLIGASEADSPVHKTYIYLSVCCMMC